MTEQQTLALLSDVSDAVGETMVIENRAQLRMISRWLNLSDQPGRAGGLSFGPTPTGGVGLSLSF